MCALGSERASKPISTTIPSKQVIHIRAKNVLPATDPSLDPSLDFSFYEIRDFNFRKTNCRCVRCSKARGVDNNS